MTIMLVGGGSGGHVTPLRAVAEELKKKHPEGLHIVAVTQKGEKFSGILSNQAEIDTVYFIRAGKFRRYHGESKLNHITDLPRLLQNIRDAFWTIFGFKQSIWLLLRKRPDLIFVKGGYVGVPIGLAAGLLRIPYITHDSDALPGLANRIIAKRAVLHAVGQDVGLYKYPKDKTTQVGVPVSSKFTLVDETMMQRYKKGFGLSPETEVLTIVGGSLGAKRVDQAFAAQAQELMNAHPNLHVLHVLGKLNEEYKDTLYEGLDEATRARIHMYGFVDDLSPYSGVAEVVVTRAGATNMAEFGVQGKACIVVPNPMLTGGHQIKNAQAYETHKAAIVVAEDQLGTLGATIAGLLEDDSQRKTLGRNLRAITIPDASTRLAELILANLKTSK